MPIPAHRVQVKSWLERFRKLKWKPQVRALATQGVLDMAQFRVPKRGPGGGGARARPA